jgi:hypothetical protein
MASGTGPALVAAVCLSLIGCDSSRFHYLENAAVIEECRPSENRPAPLARLLAGHYIERGRALVLVERVFDRGSFTGVDSASFRKLTIEVARYESGSPIAVPSTDVRLFYTHGSLPFLRQAAGFVNTHAEGTIRVTRTSADRLTVKSELTLLVTRPNSTESTTTKVRIDEEHAFTRIELGDLTPWLGTCHPAPSREARP